MIDLSVIIPVYNAAPSINRTLDSIFNQQTSYAIEVILIDDGSKDNSIEIIKTRKEANITLLRQKNEGPSAARNNGIKTAQGRYCAYLDADDYWEQGFIEKTVSFLDNHPDCVAVNVAQRHLAVSGSFEIPSCYQEYKEAFILEDFFTFWAKHMHVCTGSVLIRKEVINTIGGQRKDLRITEDLEFWAMVSTYGQWGFIPEILFVSDGGDVTRSQGWLNKMMIRWSNAPSIADWVNTFSASAKQLTKLRFLIAQYIGCFDKAIRREIIKSWYFQKAVYHYVNFKFPEAIKFFLISATSKSKKIRCISIQAIVKSNFLRIYNILK